MSAWEIAAAVCTATWMVLMVGVVWIGDAIDSDTYDDERDE